MGQYNKVNETLRRIIILFSIIFSLTAPSMEIAKNLHFWVFTLLLLTYILSQSIIISRILLFFSTLYALSFFKADSIKYLLVVGLFALSISKYFQNKWLTLALYLSVLAFFNHYLTPFFVLLFVVLNFSDSPEFKAIFESKVKVKKIIFLSSLFVIFLLLPLPDVKFNIIKVIESQERPVKVSTQQKVESYIIPGNSVQNRSNQTSETNVTKNPELIEKIENLGRERLFKLMKTLSMATVTIILLYVLLVVKRAPYEQRRTIISSFWVTVAILLFFLFVFAPTVSDVISNLKTQRTLEAEFSTGNASNQTNPATTVITQEQEKSAVTNASQNSTTDHILFIFQLLSTAAGLFAVFFLGKMYYDFLTQKTAQQEDKVAESKPTQSAVYQTNLSYKEILDLSGVEFVHHAYHYIRQNVFKGFEHLTPYELLEQFNIPELEGITVKYVEVEYAFKMEITQKDIEKLKNEFVRIIENKEKLLEPIFMQNT